MAKSWKWTDPNLPVWFDGTNINEAVFCDEFLSSHKIIYSNRAFFTPDGRVTDDLPLRGKIFERLKCCAVNNIPRKVSNILEVMKLAAQVDDFPPLPDRIHLSNGTLMLDGSFIPGKPEIVRSRLPVAYNPDAPKPEQWLSFLDGLLYPEDIVTLQEFIGYCLIPCNKGQRMMVIKGNGGEGKSQIGAVLGSLFGTNAKSKAEEIGKLLDGYLPAVEKMQTLLTKYNVTFTQTVAENKRLKKKNSQLAESLEAAQEKSVLKKLQDSQLRRDYEAAISTLERIPPEVLDWYTQGDHARKERPREYSLTSRSILI